jgi:hypothetical protein
MWLATVFGASLLRLRYECTSANLWKLFFYNATKCLGTHIYYSLQIVSNIARPPLHVQIEKAVSQQYRQRAYIQDDGWSQDHHCALLRTFPASDAFALILFRPTFRIAIDFIYDLKLRLLRSRLLLTHSS